jgi:hypothetical protein
MPDAGKNFAVSTVLTPPSPATSGTSVVLAAAGGALMPAVPFNAVVWPAGAQPLATNAEVVRVTAVATDTVTVVRAQEGSAARTVVAGDQFAAAITARTLDELAGYRAPADSRRVRANYSQIVVGDLTVTPGVVITVEPGGILCNLRS